MDAQSNASTVLERTNSGIVVSKPDLGMDGCSLFSVFHCSVHAEKLQWVAEFYKPNGPWTLIPVTMAFRSLSIYVLIQQSKGQLWSKYEQRKTWTWTQRTWQRNSYTYNLHNKASIRAVTPTVMRWEKNVCTYIECNQYLLRKCHCTIA
jgi:hypothetical protein